MGLKSNLVEQWSGRAGRASRMLGQATGRDACPLMSVSAAGR